MENWIKMWKSFPLYQQLTLITIFSTLLHYSITIICVVITFCVLIYQRKFKDVYAKQPNFTIITILLVVSVFVSAWQRNAIGAFFSVCLWVSLFVVYYFRTFISKQNIRWIIDTLLYVNIGMMAYMGIGYVVSRFVIKVQPYDYSTVLFFNENYAATIYYLLILLAVSSYYELRKKWYLILLFGNFILIDLAESRGAMIAILFGLFIYVLMLNRSDIYRKKIVVIPLVSIVCIYILGVMLKFLPQFQIEYIYKYVTYRVAIWNTALQSFFKHSLIGQGQFSHLNYCKEFGSLCIAHAHNLFLELLVVFGILGNFLIIYTAKYDIPKIRLLKKHHRNYFAVIIALVATVSVHGLVDYQLFWVQTGILFFALMGIMDITKNSSQ